MDIEAIVKKYWTGTFYESHFRAALTELSESHAIELRAYEATVENLEERIRQLEAERVPEGWRHGLDSLRWLLNISSEGDRPNARVSTLLDKCRTTDGMTTRQSLELLLAAAPQQKKEGE